MGRGTSVEVKWYVFKKLQLVLFAYCTWPLCNFNNVSINYSAPKQASKQSHHLTCFVECNGQIVVEGTPLGFYWHVQ